MATSMGGVPLRLFPFGGPFVITLGPFLVLFLSVTFLLWRVKTIVSGQTGLKFCL